MTECTVNVKNEVFRLCFIYRPPPSKVNTFGNSVFFEEWSQFLDHGVTIPEELVMTGDLNFHLDDVTDCDAQKFLDTLEDVQHHMSLVKHTSVVTHLMLSSRGRIVLF